MPPRKNRPGKKTSAARPIEMRPDAPETVTIGDVTIDQTAMDAPPVVSAPLAVEMEMTIPAPLPDAPQTLPDAPAPVNVPSLSSLFPSRRNASGTSSGHKGRPKEHNPIALPGLSTPNAIAVRSIAEDIAAYRTHEFANGHTYLVASDGMLTTRWNHTTPLSVPRAEKGRKTDSPRTYLGIIDAIEHVDGGDAARRALRLAPDARERIERLTPIREMTDDERNAVARFYRANYSTSNLHDAREDDAAPRRCDRLLSVEEIRAAIARSTLTA